MVLFDLKTLLKKCLAEGFTLESISKATDIPVELIVRFRHERLNPEDIHTLNYLQAFLMQLYAVNPDDESYLKDMVWVMNHYFEISSRTIETYLNLEENGLELFLNKPEAYHNGLSISKRLIHLFTTLIRDKRYSTQ